MRPAAERAAEKERIGQQKFLEGTVSVREVLNYIESDRYLDLREATSTRKGQRFGYLPLSEKTLRQHLNEIPHFRCGGKIIFKKSELDRWMESFRVRDQDLDAAMEMAEELLG